MGSFGSREVQTQTMDYSGPLMRIFINFISFGFVLGLFIHEHEISLWGTYFDHLNIFQYCKGFYFFWYTVTWFIVYVGFYILVLDNIIYPLLLFLVGYRRELQCELLIQMLFGLWICGEILGSWIDFSRTTDCLYTHDCKSSFMESIMNSMESTCEYFTAYHYDESRGVYIYNRRNLCYDIFHAAPGFFMTILSTSLAYLMLILVGIKSYR